MRLMRLGPLDGEVPVALSDGIYYDLRELILDIDGAAVAPGMLAAIRSAVRSGTVPRLDDADLLRVGAPVARPGAIIGIGMNYAAHAIESGAEPPVEPVVFLKAPSSMTGPFDSVAIPRGSKRTDWEVELALVIGERAHYLDSPAEARRVIAGFLVANDLSERTWQLESASGQWARGKSAAGFTPLGPWLVPADEVDPTRLRLWSRVGGAPRQDSSTADLIFDVDHIVWYLSQYMVLEAGDVVLTGTPEGVALSGRFPYLSAGDEVEVEVEGLGRQRTRMVAA